MSDLISRQDAIDAVIGAEYPHKTEDGIPIADGTRKVSSCIKRLKAMPSATKIVTNCHGLKQKHSKWIALDTDSRGFTEHFECANCGGITWLVGVARYCRYNYCPNCGAEME